jgi:hypothetical protein
MEKMEYFMCRSLHPPEELEERFHELREVKFGPRIARLWVDTRMATLPKRGGSCRGAPFAPRGSEENIVARRIGS